MEMGEMGIKNALPQTSGNYNASYDDSALQPNDCSVLIHVCIMQTAACVFSASVALVSEIIMKKSFVRDWSTNVIKTASSAWLSLSVFATGPPPFLLFSSNGRSSSSTSMSPVTPDTTIKQP